MTSDQNTARADEPLMPDVDAPPTEAGSAGDAGSPDRPADRSTDDASTDRPDMRDPTNGSPYLTGESTTAGLGGSGKETAGGGTGPKLDGGTVPGGTSDRRRRDA